jgi:glucose dehydrogenase
MHCESPYSLPPDAWRLRGGTVWGVVAYDPGTNLIFYGTPNPGPWNADAAGTPYIGATVRYYAGPGGNMGEIMA